MLAARTLKILAALAGAYVLLLALAYWGPAFLEPIGFWAVLVPLLSLYLFHYLGFPGLLEHGGHCGWGWCSPTAFGWAVLVVFWTGVAWLLAWGLARLTAGWRRPAA